MFKKFIYLFKKIFNRKKQNNNNNNYSLELKNIINFVEYTVKALVDIPQFVKIELIEEKTKSIIKIKCNKKMDIGKIIGKNGKTIISIRFLVKNAAYRINRKIGIEVIEVI